MKNRMMAMCFLLGTAFVSCKKENNYYLNGQDKGSTAPSEGENYDVSREYIGGHKFIIVDHFKAPLNAKLSWKLQGLDAKGNKENMFVYVSTTDLDIYYWDPRYQPGGTIDGSKVLDILSAPSYPERI